MGNLLSPLLSYMMLKSVSALYRYNFQIIGSPPISAASIITDFTIVRFQKPVKTWILCRFPPISLVLELNSISTVSISAFLSFPQLTALIGDSLYKVPKIYREPFLLPTKATKWFCLPLIVLTHF